MAGVDLSGEEVELDVKSGLPIEIVPFSRGLTSVFSVSLAPNGNSMEPARVPFPTPSTDTEESCWRLRLLRGLCDAKTADGLIWTSGIFCACWEDKTVRFFAALALPVDRAAFSQTRRARRE